MQSKQKFLVSFLEKKPKQSLTCGCFSKLKVHVITQSPAILSAGQVQFTSTYNGQKVFGTLGSSLNFTWTFTGDMKSAEWGTKKSGVNEIDTILVALTTTGSGPVALPPRYAERVNGTWDGKTSPGRVTFTLNSIRENDGGFYACQIAPVNLLTSAVVDTVQLFVRG